MTFRNPLTGSYKILNRSFLLERSNRIDDPRRVFYTALLLSENCEQYYDRVGNLVVEPITYHDKVNADMEIKYVLKRGWIDLDINQEDDDLEDPDVNAYERIH